MRDGKSVQTDISGSRTVIGVPGKKGDCNDG